MKESPPPRVAHGVIRRYLNRIDGTATACQALPSVPILCEIRDETRCTCRTGNRHPARGGLGAGHLYEPSQYGARSMHPPSGGRRVRQASVY